MTDCTRPSVRLHDGDGPNEPLAGYVDVVVR